MSRAQLQVLLKDTSELGEGSLQPAEKPSLPSHGNYVVAVGLAALDINSCSTLWLAQYVEATRGFTTTLTMLELYPPDVLLTVASKNPSVPDTGLNAALSAFETIPLSRNTFDDSEGTVLVQMCAADGFESDLGGGRGNCLSLGAAGALLKFMREERGLFLASSFLKVRHALSSHHTHIDAASIEALELVQAAPGPGGPRCTSTSLLKFLDGTRTKAGAQLLRANILQPLKDITTLSARYEALDELRENAELASTLGGCLAQLPRNMDSVCGSLVLKPAKSQAGMLRRVSAMIQSTIQLRELLTALEPLATALEVAESELLCALRGAVTDPAFSVLRIRLDGLLDEDVCSTPGPFLNRTQQCFALRSGEIPLLDVARQAFCSTTEAVHEHAAEMRNTHDLPGLKVQYTARRGFYFSISMQNSDYHGEDKAIDAAPEATAGGGKRRRRQGTSSLAADRLPSSMTLLQSNGKTIQCTTDEMNALNSRLRDAANDCLCLTEEALEGVSTDIVEEYMPSLHRLIDGLALLDMVCGFARQLEGSGKTYVRPALTTAGPLALVGCRHPVLELAEEGGGVGGFEFESNDTWLSIDSSLHIITGPNMAGKSTYLRQVAAAVVMAQVGCHVAADFASLTPVDRILTRIGTADCLETNSSSFMVEMQETAYILRNATSQSLVLIDELGRATSTADGLGVAWAVAEAMAATGARTLLATHFTELAELADMYPQCRVWNFEVKTDGGRLEYLWKLKPGKCENKHYGLALAQAVAFPAEALERAKTVVKALDLEAVAVAARETGDPAQTEEERAVWEIVGKMACLAQAFLADGDDAELVVQMKSLQQEAAQTFG